MPKTQGAAGFSDVPPVLCGTCFSLCAVANVRQTKKVREWVTKGGEAGGISEKVVYRSVW